MSLTHTEKELAIKEAAKVATAWAESSAAGKIQPEEIFERVYKKIAAILEHN